MSTVTNIKRNARKFATSVRDIPDTYLICRDLGHAWDYKTDSVLYDAQGKRAIEVTRTVKCLRCKMDRVDHYELPSFIRTRTKYSYPDHYLLSRDTHREQFTRADARGEFYLRRHGGFS